MKTMRTLALVLALTTVASTLVFAGSKSVTLTNTDKYKNEIRFVSEAPLEKITGTANDINGTFNIDLQNLGATKGTLTVPVISMKTGSSSRDKHMYDDEWLDEEKFKTISYNVKGLKDAKVETSGGGRTIVTATAMGDFTLHGVTKYLEAKVKITYVNETNETKQIAAGDLVLIQADFFVPLKAHNVFGKGGIVGTKVGENIAINATLFGTTK
ncbi:MAG: YceI family protein [Bacteriodetes bacterium]|nr:YceI family protein [Bacteroidota bacterium]